MASRKSAQATGVARLASDVDDVYCRMGCLGQGPLSKLLYSFEVVEFHLQSCELNMAAVKSLSNDNDVQ